MSSSCAPIAGSTNGKGLGMPAMTGLLYDQGAYQTDLRQSVGVGSYVLAPVGPHCQTCVPLDPRMSAGMGGGVGTCAPTVPLVDVESDLHNITRRATNDPCGLYRGNGGPPTGCGGAPMTQGSAGTVGSGAPRQMAACDVIPTVDTRLVNPPCTLRGTGWNRFEWLCRDPQERALVPFGANVDTSLVIKDNHRPFLARPVDPTLALPPGGKGGAGPDVGAPQWMPPVLGNCAVGVGAVEEPPCMMWAGCGDVQKIR